MTGIFKHIFYCILFISWSTIAQENIKDISTLLEEANSHNRINDELMYALADSADQIMTNSQNYSDQYFEAAYIKSRVLVRKGEDLKAISYLDKQLKNKIETTKNVGQAHFILGLAYRHISNQNKTIFHYNRAIQIFDSLNVCTSSAKANNNLGNYYNATSSFELALDKYKSALDKLKECPDDYLAAILERNIGGVYFNYFKDLDKGESYFISAITSFSKLDSTNKKVINSLLGARISLGTLLSEKGNYDTALSIFVNAHKKSRKEHLIIREIESLSGAAYVLSLKFKLNESEARYLEAIKLAEEKSYNYLLSELYTGLSTTYFRNKKYKKALYFLDKAFLICDKNDYLQQKAEVLRSQAFTLYELQQRDSAFLKISEYSQLKDQIFNDNNNRLIKAKQADIELLKKDQEIKILRLEQEKNEVIKNSITRELSAKNNLLIAFAGILILGILISITLIKNRNKRAKISELQLENERDKLEHSLLVNQKMAEIKLFKTAIESKKEEQERISRDLHDNIGATLAAIKLSLVNGETNTEEIIPFLDNVYNHVRDLSHHLSSISQEQVNFEDILKGYIDKLTKLSNINIHFEVVPLKSFGTISEKYQAELFSIIREGLNNAIKHSGTKEIELVLTREDNSINLYLEDHGIGLDINKQTKGIGLKNIKTRVHSLGGDIEIDTHPDRGVILNITIPYGN